MKFPAKLVAATAALTLGIASAALASGPGHSGSAPGHNKTSSTTTTTTTGTAPNSHAKAYGRLCQGESKKHVPGQKGTPFSKCVTDLARMDHSSQTGSGSSTTTTGSRSTTNPAKACANESKKHVAGQKGTPFSQCVSAAAKLRGEENGQNGGSGSDGSTTTTSTTTTTGS